MSDRDRGRTPNLFNYATKELSQDAMLCYLLDWVNYPKTPLGNVGRSFLGLFASKLPLKVDWSGLTHVEVRRQLAKADVVAICNFQDGSQICIVIEDKISAMLAGDDQVERNKRKVCVALGSDIWADRTFSFLFKTTYDYDCILPTGCLKVNYLDVKRWISSLSAKQLKSSEILKSWLDVVSEHIHRTEEVISSACNLKSFAKAEGTGSTVDNRLRDGRWSDPIFQYQILRHLLRIPGTVLYTKERPNRRTIGVGYQPDDERGTFLLTSHHGEQRAALWCMGRGKFYYEIDFRRGRWVLLLRYHRKKGSSIKRARQVGIQYARALNKQLIEAEVCSMAKTPWPMVLIIDPGKSPGLPVFFKVHSAFLTKLRNA